MDDTGWTTLVLEVEYFSSGEEGVAPEREPGVYAVEVLVLDELSRLLFAMGMYPMTADSCRVGAVGCLPFGAPIIWLLERLLDLGRRLSCAVGSAFHPREDLA